jgi:hypothetical protein
MKGRPPKAPKITYVCKQCGASWQDYEWTNDRKGYCSRACFAASQKGKKRQLVKPQERACLSCGKIFLVGGMGNRTKIAQYCSRSCARHRNWGELAHPDARVMTNEERIWLAGIFDGEGCIAWPRRTIIRSVRLDLTSTSKALIDRIIAVTATGRVTEKKSRSLKHSVAWVWRCYGENARSILRQIHPWLIVKKEAADVVLGLVEAAEPPWTQRTRTMREVNSSEAS